MQRWEGPTTRATGNSSAWVLSFSGQNLCAMGGQLLLRADRDEVDTRHLTIGGLPWQDDGRRLAERLLMKRVREEATALWPVLPPTDRIRLLHALSQDPDPEAAEVLGVLRRLDSASAADIDQAMQRWHASSSGR